MIVAGCVPPDKPTGGPDGKCVPVSGGMHKTDSMCSEKKYGCDTSGACVQNSSGPYSDAGCSGQCTVSTCPGGVDLKASQPPNSVQIVNNTSESPFHVFLEYANMKLREDNTPSGLPWVLTPQGEPRSPAGSTRPVLPGEKLTTRC